ncbi:MAG TPA: DinB family protein [Pseudonocardiaceae bacterium]|nr:DinB family protein [Pseudonocardiaceae bacterium]
MTRELDDLVELSDFAWERLRNRLAGLTEEEYRWEPVADCWTVRPSGDGTFMADGRASTYRSDGEPDPFTTLPWRLHHITHVLGIPRNARWLDRPDPRAVTEPAGTAADALARLADAYAAWRTVLTGVSAEVLERPMGNVARPYEKSTGRAFVLHVLDELIHHAAEVALLRDLYAARETSM